MLAQYDLRRWMFTDLVTVDETIRGGTIRGGISHPLTISPGPGDTRPEETNRNAR